MRLKALIFLSSICLWPLYADNFCDRVLAGTDQESNSVLALCQTMPIWTTAAHDIYAINNSQPFETNDFPDKEELEEIGMNPILGFLIAIKSHLKDPDIYKGVRESLWKEAYQDKEALNPDRFESTMDKLRSEFQETVDAAKTKPAECASGGLILGNLIEPIDTNNFYTVKDDENNISKAIILYYYFDNCQLHKRNTFSWVDLSSGTMPAKEEIIKNYFLLESNGSLGN